MAAQGKDPPGAERAGSSKGAKPERKRFLLRLSPDLHAILERWAADELRSLNGQIEYLLQDAVNRAGRGGRRRPSPPA